MMPHLLPLVLSLSAPAAASDDAGAFITVDRAAWLYLTPDAEGARLRSTDLPQAPEFTDAPVVVLLQMGPARNGWIPARIVTHDAPRRSDGGLLPPDATPSDWSHCYAQPPVLAQTRLDVYVRDRDVLPVLTRDVQLERADGAVIQLERGLTLIGSGKRYRVRGTHIDLIVDDLPKDAIGEGYTRDRPPAQRLFVAEQSGGTWAVQPTYQIVLDAQDDALSLAKHNHTQGPSASVQVLRDRCVRVAFSEPVSPVPRQDETRLRGASTWPITVPPGVAVTSFQGERLGETGAAVVLWSRQQCGHDEHRGMCCDPVPGTQAEHLFGGLCYRTQIPDQHAGRSLERVFTDRSRRMREAIGTAVAVVPTVTILDLETQGVLSADAARAVLESELDAFETCYARRLPLQPSLAGDVRMRFAVGPNAHARTPRVLSDSFGGPTVLDCINDRLEIPAFVDQVGQAASIVDVTLRFRTLPGEAPASSAD